jgi:predicted 3-demethylubiquinone-9 3-methyltransferase (glyoxalase superfamily)
VQCGWLKDKYGLSWQIVPSCLPEMMRQADPPTNKRVMDAVMQMTKLDIAALQAAYEEKVHQ